MDITKFENLHKYAEECKKEFRQTISSWTKHSESELKPFSCDKCQKVLEVDSDGLRKGYHMWKADKETLAEFHFHKACGNLLGVL